MNIKTFVKGMVFAIPLLLTSCNDEGQISVENKCKIICSVDKFESVSMSRTNTDPDNGFLITWASGDVIGIFPREGYQEPFEIPTNQIGNKSATFDGGYWDVKDGLLYNAYYPFDKRNFDSAEMKTQIPVSYVGQTQNGTSCDIGAFDYTYSDWGTAVNGSISFDFHHIGAIAVFSLKYPATTTYTKMTLSVDDKLIPLEGSYDLTATDVAFVADESSKSESISLTLNNCYGVAGETGVFYMMLPPMDLSNREVTLTLASSVGTTSTYSLDKELNTKKGKLYRRTGVPVASNVEGTVDGWIEDEEDTTPYVTFETDSEYEFSMSKAVETLEYSVNGGEWSELGTKTIIFGGGNGNLRLRGQKSAGTGNKSNPSTIKFSGSVLGSPIYSSGDIRTLIDYKNYDTVFTGNARFCELFKGCSKLSGQLDLPATTLADYCYYRMFEGCYGNIISSLPATTLAEGCYSYMFYNCSNLRAPSLPATSLAKNCYAYMFANCKDLSISPSMSLPAKTLKDNCYEGMFLGCTSLTTVPTLSAEVLAPKCYASMFAGCTSLTTMPTLPAKTLKDYCYYSMFEGCTSLKNVTSLPATTLAEGCYSYMFSYCENLKTSPELPATTLANNCYECMFSNCYNLTVAPSLPATILTDWCYALMFENCYSLTTAPKLSAKTLAECSYGWMFYCCENLNNITMLATDISASDCLAGWVDGVASTGTFTKAKTMTSLQRGIDGIPDNWTIKNE